ncbi:Di-copper centre-containing protein [Lentithecium fluviatile CBS 122367]|uniref:tyrosinase n=1 Tax=Lentithecium fluviatile CBS 122367 TaxID=1168545 RepID=A0A6G1JCT9_9PLEO|nr:Di-copper centre-containing protein [Lentithecium fluviatile CBS 122367]
MVRDRNAPSRNGVVARNLNKIRQNIQNRVEVQGPNNIENIHRTIHNTSGGNGHMWNLRYSAFDLIFWLHHSNEDSLFAVWEALDANYSVPRYSNTAQAFTMSANTATGGDTPLKPFHKDELGNFWTSNEIRDTHTFACTYPILQNLRNTDTLIRRVNSLYSPRQSIPAIRRTKRGAVTVAFGSGVQYTLSVKAQQASLKGSPSVFVLLGGVEETHRESGGEDWESDLHFVGQTSFIQQNVDMASSDDSPTVHSVVPLTAALEARHQFGELSSMVSASVYAYLKENVKWKIAKNGKALPGEESSGFEISVLWREIEPAMSLDEFPNPQSEEQVLM